MSKTPRTDAEFEANGLERCVATDREMWKLYVSTDFASQLETELTAKTAELEDAKRQMDSWLKEHDSMIRTARAAAFEEAADMGLTVDDKWVQSGIDTLSAEIHKKAASIRKGEEE